MPDFPTITHVALTVSDLDRSVPWYERLFGTKAVLDEDTGPFRHVVWAIGSTLVGLHQFPDPRSETFDDSEANRYVGREHRKGFELPEIARERTSGGTADSAPVT